MKKLRRPTFLGWLSIAIFALAAFSLLQLYEYVRNYHSQTTLAAPAVATTTSVPTRTVDLVIIDKYHFDSSLITTSGTNGKKVWDLFYQASSANGPFTLIKAPVGNFRLRVELFDHRPFFFSLPMCDEIRLHFGQGDLGFLVPFVSCNGKEFSPEPGYR